MKMNKRAGFTLVEIMIVVAIIGLLAAIAIPSFMKARTTSQQSACLNNLRLIESAAEQWSMLPANAAGTPALSDLYKADGTGYLKVEPKCPYDGLAASYTITKANNIITVSCANHGTVENPTLPGGAAEEE
jgi:prepilin-type N-terminal cleavage/methylation domain-containing protein